MIFRSKTKMLIAVFASITLLVSGCDIAETSPTKKVGNIWDTSSRSRSETKKNDFSEYEGYIQYLQSPGVPKTNALDFSWLNEMPAGKRGHVLVSGEEFVFEDGTPVKFFGVNLAFDAATPDKEVAEAMATELASMGVNFVRLHGVDCSYSGIVDYISDDVSKINNVKLDKLDYLVYCLKQKGIYIHLDTNAGRILKSGEGFNALEVDYAKGGTLRAARFFDERIVELETEFIKTFLTHINTYTGMSYAEDPVIAVVQYANESSITWFTSYNENNTFRELFQSRYNSWLIEKYKTREALVKAWTNVDGEMALKDSEDPADGSVQIPPIGGWGEAKVKWFTSYDETDCAPRYADFMEFLIELQTKVFTDAYSMIRGLGYKSAINCSNQPEAAVDNKLNSLGDIMEKNAYWNHPVGPYTIPTRFVFKEMTGVDPSISDTIVSIIARAAVTNKPMVVTEWNATTPTEFKADVIFETVAYASLQGWDGFCLFVYSFEGDKDFFFLTNEYTSFFNSNCDPAMWAQFGMASAIFRLGLIKEAENTIEYTLTDEDVLAGTSEYHIVPRNSVYVSKIVHNFIGDVYEGDADLVISSGNTSSGDYRKAKNLVLFSENPFNDARQKRKDRIGWINRHTVSDMRDEIIGGVPVKISESRAIINKDFNTEYIGKIDFKSMITEVMQQYKLIDETKGWQEDKVVSDTGEIVLNYADKNFFVETERVAIFAGKTKESVDVGPLHIKTSNELAAVALYSAENSQINKSGRLLLYAMGRSFNYGMEWEDDTLTKLGSGPILYEDIRGSIEIESSKKICHVWGLDYKGARINEINTTATDAGFEFSIGGFCNYEIVLD